MAQGMMWSRPRRYEVGDYARNLFDVVRDLETGIIKIPAFQRDFVWPAAKREQFVKRLMDGRKPIGVIATYELENDIDTIVYLNDGYQRLSTLRQLLRESNLYGLTGEQAEELLKCFSFSVQHRSYKTHDEAAEDYKDINQGTPLTAFEFYLADLANIKDYESVWRPRIERLHEMVKLFATSVCAKPQTERSIAHRYIRHNLSLFYRFVTSEVGVTTHAVNARSASPTERAKKTYIEYRFGQWLLSHGTEMFDAKLKTLQAVIENETAMIEYSYRSVQADPALRIGVVMYRWLLDAAIWRRNNKIGTEAWADFLRKVMIYTGGTQTFPGTAKKNALIVMGDLTRLKYICFTVGSTMYEGDQSRRVRRLANAQAGYDMSHIVPFSLHGEGPTVMEPASINRARGAKPISAKEI